MLSLYCSTGMLLLQRVDILTPYHSILSCVSSGFVYREETICVVVFIISHVTFLTFVTFYG